MAVIFGTGALWGALWFSVGFFGPMLLGGGNQGPLLGILITGPLGFLVGCGVGTYRVVSSSRRDKAPGEGAATLTLWQRSGVAIIAAFLAEALLSGAINSVAWYAGLGDGSVVLASAGAGIAGGYVAAHLAPQARFAHASVLAAVQMTLSVLGSFGHRGPGAARAVIFQGVFVSAATLLGGYMRASWSSE